jgi:DNA processing protein
VSASRARHRSPDSAFDVRAAARAILPGSPDYPERLHDLPIPPALLWAVGDIATLAPPVVAIVGTRRSTAYGERVARELASALARAGACIVSGMARGIDGTAHVAALGAGGRTVAVLGTGVDVAYPVAHRPLHKRIAAQGLLLSEMALGAGAHKGSFPERNRIIAALADAVIVVEAPIRSGALGTATRADELGRKVAAIPGPIDAPQSEGSNLLLRDSAVLLPSVDDALALVGLSAPARGASAISTEAEARVWEALVNGPLGMDELCARAGLPVAQCVAAVGALELRGSVECPLTGEIRRR